MKKLILSVSITAVSAIPSLAQCVNEDNVHSFTYAGKNYEIVKENKTWADAAACAVERGGTLVRIDSVEENTAMFDELTTAGVVASETTAPDGGGGSYIWLGGTDKSVESRWLWDVNNDDSGDQFWDGGVDGSPTGGLYSNWGDEPDDFGSGQDALGLSVNGWPLGVASEWNDVDLDNELYFIIEYPESSQIDETSNSFEFSVYPNPVNDKLTIITPKKNGGNYKILSIEGALIEMATLSDDNQIDVNHLKQGVYILEITLDDGSNTAQRFTIQ